MPLKRLDGIIRRSPVVAISWRNEPGWPVAYVSDNVAMFGYKPQQLLSGEIGYERLVHPDDLGRVSACVMRPLSTGPKSISLTRDISCSMSLSICTEQSLCMTAT